MSYRHWTDSLYDSPDDWELDPVKFEAWLEESGFEPHPSRHGEWISAECPDCGSGGSAKAWRFMVDSSRGIMSCFGCGLPDRRRGDPFQLVADMDGSSIDEARRLIGSMDIITVETDFEAPTKKPERFVLPEEPKAPNCVGVEWWNGQSVSAEWMVRALEATMARGYTQEFLLSKSIGFGANGRYEGRVVIPVFSNGQFVWLQAWDWTKTSDIKYHSPKRGDGMLRQNLVYQLDTWSEAEVLVVCEGAFNSWAVELAGYPAVATFGKGMTDAQWGLLFQSKAKTIVLAYDDDAIDVARRKAVQFRAYGKRVLLVRYPDGRDMDDHHVKTVQALVSQASELHWFDDAPAARRSKTRPGGPPMKVR